MRPILQCARINSLGAYAGLSKKNRSISRDASGPRGSVYEPSGLPPDHACPSPVDGPVFHLGNATRVGDHGARVSAATRRPVMARLQWSSGEASASFGHDHFGVRRMNRLIGRTMKNNCANPAVRALAMAIPCNGLTGHEAPRMAANAEAMSVADP